MRAILICLALAYVILPRDLIPDVAPIFGWLDDLLVIYLAWRFLIRPFIQNRPATDPTTKDRQAPPKSKSPRSPHEILGIPPDASATQIKDAFHKLANQYHPDKVAHLGEDFQRLAEQRFKEINDAYQSLTR